MIKINVRYLQDQIDQVKVTGHAGFDEYGKDIVCAAASTLVTASINNILCIEDSIEAVYQDETLIIIVKEATIINQSILNSMLAMLEEIEYDYNQNIVIKEE